MIERLFELLIAFLPIFAVYISPIPGVDLGTFLSFVLFVALLVSKRTVSIWKNGTFWALLFYTLADTLFMLLFTSARFSTTTSILFRLFRFLFMLIAYIGVGMTGEFDMKRFLKILRVVTLLVAGYAIAQQIAFRLTGVKLINVFGATKQGVVFNPTLGEYETVYRPPSVFLEPSGVTYYVIPYLCFCLFSDEYSQYFGKKSAIRDALFISIGLIATTSGMGLTSIAIAWLLWVAKILKKKNVRKTFIAVPLLAAAGIAFKTSNLIHYSIERIFNDAGTSAVEARSYGYAVLRELSLFHKIFGTGFGNYDETVYYTSIADILFCTGVVGFVLVAVFYLQLYRKGNAFQKGLVFLSFVLMLGGGIYSATYLCFYLPLLVYIFPNREDVTQPKLQC